jgi:hypothetical protein
LFQKEQWMMFISAGFIILLKADISGESGNRPAIQQDKNLVN